MQESDRLKAILDEERKIKTGRRIDPVGRTKRIFYRRRR